MARPVAPVWKALRLGHWMRRLGRYLPARRVAHSNNSAGIHSPRGNKKVSSKMDKSYSGSTTSSQAGETIKPNPHRVHVLQEAAKITAGPREQDYGPVTQNFERMAAMMRGYMQNRHMGTFTAADAAAFNAIIKLSRLSNNNQHHDSWVDLAAYAGIGAECSVNSLK